MNQKLKIAILMGGKSAEHEVSLSSGREVMKHIDRKKFSPRAIVIPKNGSGIEKVMAQLSKVDVVFIAMHGPYGEDGTIQGMLELVGLPYTGPGVLASAIGMNKIIFKQLLHGQGITVPKTVSKSPCFVKPANQGSSVGASLVREKKDLKKAIKFAKKYSKEVLIEEYLSGTEVTCAVLGNKKPQALPLVEIIPLKGEFFDYESKYTESGAEEIVPARISKTLTKKVQKIAVEVYELLGCRGFSRVDFILKDNKEPVVLEINTIPGLTQTSLLPKAAQAAGISYRELITKVIEYAIK